MAQRQGQVIKRANRKFLIRWFLRVENGVNKYASRIVHGTKREAESALREVLAKQDKGLPVESKCIDLNTYLDTWLDVMAPKDRRPRTVRHYREMLERYVRPTLGTRRVDRLTVFDVQALVNELEGRGLSAQTVKYAKAVLSAAMADAVVTEQIGRNPCRDVKVKKGERDEARFLTEDEANRFRAAAQGTRLEGLWILLLGTGMRPGEALALRWQDLDLAVGSLRVSHTLVRGKGGWSLGEPKNRRSRRTIALPPTVIRALEAHKAAQARERLQVGNLYEALDFCFATPFGQPLDHRNMVQRWFKPLLRKAGLDPTIPLYALRHTCASAALAAGAQGEAVAKMLGHSPAVLANTYAHVMKAKEDEVTRLLEQSLQ